MSSKALMKVLCKESQELVKIAITPTHKTVFVFCAKKDANKLAASLRNFYEAPKAEVFFFDCEVLATTIVAIQLPNEVPK